MNIAICDDLQEERAVLRSALEQFFLSENIRGEIFEYCSGEALLEDFTPGKFQLIFLDIYMDGITGIQTARNLKQQDPDCLLIFTTTSVAHGADAFDVDAFHYLVKPLDMDKLHAVLRRWKKLLNEIQAVSVKCGRDQLDIAVRDILYVEVHGRSCTVHTATGAIQTNMTLSALEALLPQDQFIKPIRYCLVSLRYIRHIHQTELELEDGTRLPFSRGERDNLRQLLSSYRLRQLRGR